MIMTQSQIDLRKAHRSSARIWALKLLRSDIHNVPEIMKKLKAFYEPWFVQEVLSEVSTMQLMEER